MKGKKAQKIIHKALDKAIDEIGLEFPTDGRHGYIVTAISETDEGMHCFSLLCDPQASHEEDIFEAVSTGGHVGFVIHTAHMVFSESLEKVVKESPRFVGLLNSVNTFLEDK
jgi:hypothetical protein